MGVSPPFIRTEGNNMENKKQPSVVMADTLIKDRSVITMDGQTIRNTPENPTAVEDYYRSLRK